MTQIARVWSTINSTYFNGGHGGSDGGEDNGDDSYDDADDDEDNIFRLIQHLLRNYSI